MIKLFVIIMVLTANGPQPALVMQHNDSFKTEAECEATFVETRHQIADQLVAKGLKDGEDFEIEHKCQVSGNPA